jgi:hypothetical protein
LRGNIVKELNKFEGGIFIVKQVIMLKSFNEPEGENQKIVGLGRQGGFFDSSRLVVPVKGIVANEGVSVDVSVDVSVHVSVHVGCQCENDKVVG